ncbi:hypothetical protein Bhyg_05508 [Pseudolycoriella hygida]|uniref:Uncharacterized protein n=1 Tax=Pseudolycoriella hygida TaxID=35572 RepID=A0A9Q0N0A4_9DIPT|nr:hypothetical protein Bhyg_05508 [Pseudolycoriella hygida]
MSITIRDTEMEFDRILSRLHKSNIKFIEPPRFKIDTINLFEQLMVLMLSRNKQMRGCKFRNCYLAAYFIGNCEKL